MKVNANSQKQVKPDQGLGWEIIAKVRRFATSCRNGEFDIY
ncbi:hypothetical protein XIS1_900122 [Xenorhabdus innexi]|uniref:Uncharacterized protein n=1 Tax=Xenorhabdus innexi TaxID=290109 RepID=A0A1N6N1Z2_9GAMM|nr:hypothetical protein XIS1_900122 [Xenorhabdus innexi]